MWLIIEGLAELAKTLKLEKHEDEKNSYFADPVSSFNDKFGGLPKPDQYQPDLPDNEADFTSSQLGRPDSHDK